MRLTCPCCGHTDDEFEFEEMEDDLKEFDEEKKRRIRVLLSHNRSKEDAVRKGFGHRLQEESVGDTIRLSVYGKTIAWAHEATELWDEAFEYLADLGDEAIHRGVAFA